MNLLQISTDLLKKGLRVARVPADGDPECVGSVECVECGWRADGLRLDVLAGEKDAGCVPCEQRRLG